MLTEVYTLTTFPYSAVALVRATFPNGERFYGTGAVVGRNDVLTATHIVYSPIDGGWATNIEVFPGADFNTVSWRFESTPYNLGTYDWVVYGWPDQVFADYDDDSLSWSESQYDFAVIGLSVPVGDMVGMFKLDPGYNSSGYGYELGYSDGSTGLMRGGAWYTYDSAHSLYFASKWGGSDILAAGSSGGPLYVNKLDGSYIIGVTSSGDISRTWWADVGFVYDHLQALIKDNDYLLGKEVKPAALTLPQMVATQLLVAYLGRPADVATLQKYAEHLGPGNSPTLAQQKELFASSEATRVFGAGASVSAVVAKAFQLVGRTASSSDLAAWTDWAVKAKLDIAQMPWEIMKVAMQTESTFPADKQYVWNRLAVSYEFALDLTNPNVVAKLGYDPSTQDAARAIVLSVSNSASVAKADQSIASFINGNSGVFTPLNAQWAAAALPPDLLPDLGNPDAEWFNAVGGEWSDFLPDGEMSPVLPSVIGVASPF